MTSNNLTFKFIKLALLFVLSFIAFSSTASAMSISPKVIDIEVEKRELMVRDIVLKNDSGHKRIYPMVNEITVDDNGEIKSFEYVTNEARTDTITAWLEISRGRITLQPNEEKVVPLTIRVHPQAKPGLYHAFIGFPVAGDKERAKQQVLAGNAPGVVVRISIGAERTEFLKLEGFNIERFVTDPTENVVSYTLSNTGESELAPSGEIIFYNTNGSEVASIPINPEATEINPDEILEFTSELPDSFKAGKYKAFFSLQYGTEQLASLTDTSFFYVMPLSTMIIIFGVVLMFALLLTIILYRKMTPQVIHHTGVEDVSMYLREGVSEAKDHDIDLKQKKTE